MSAFDEETPNHPTHVGYFYLLMMMMMTRMKKMMMTKERRDRGNKAKGTKKMNWRVKKMKQKILKLRSRNHP